jgi:1-acyl-sn-glycerol-3-phosphate acyltransferase
MALGALAEDPTCGVKIVPCGMNYFHAHKFRSRAVVEIGSPVEIPNELVEMYKNGQKREAVGQVLETVYQALVSVTVTSPDYDTLMVCFNLQYSPAYSNADTSPAHSSSETFVQSEGKETPSTHDRRT